MMCSKRDSNSHGHFCPKDFKSFVSTIPPFERPRAENETRTRDPNLGKVVLYQLSYFRIQILGICFKTSEEEETRTPTTQLSLPPQSSASTNSATSPVCLNVIKVFARKRFPIEWENLRFDVKERKTRLELATPTLARLCSTNWAISAFYFFALRRSVVLSNRYWRFCECKGMNFSHTGKTFPCFFSKKVHFPRKKPIFARFLCKKQGFRPYWFFKAAHKKWSV